MRGRWLRVALVLLVLLPGITQSASGEDAKTADTIDLRQRQWLCKLSVEHVPKALLKFLGIHALFHLVTTDRLMLG